MRESTTPPRSDSVSPDTQHRVEQFLYAEAELLDTFQLKDWLALLTEDIMIKVPIRTYTHPGTEQSEFSEKGYYLRDNYDMIRERVGRLKKSYAWSENPRSRIRHVIGNVRITEVTEESYTVTNNQHVYRSYGDTPENDTLSARRDTVLQRGEAGFKIADRTVFFEDSIVSTKNITLPLL
jgi:3-phenylpropionate/cinnamic acid dioxygenase small subunit